MAEINPYFKDIDTGLNNISLTDLNDCNILITGSTGLIGGCLVDMLMKSPCTCKVYALGRNEVRARRRFLNYWKTDRFHFIKGDVINPLSCQFHFDYIIHAASNASPNFFKERPVEVMMSNIAGVKNLMEYGLKHGMKRFLFVSSGEVYGEGDGRIFTEDYSGYVDCTKPRSCYPTSKRAAETLCVSYISEYGADAVIARPCHVYGPYFTESDNRVYAQFIRNVLRDEDIVMKSSGEQFRSWCYVVDCVLALLYILLKGKCSEAYNIADNSSNISIRQLAETIANIGGKKVVVDTPDISEQEGYNTVTKSVFDTSKLESLGWTPMKSIQEGLESTINHIKQLSPDCL